jgi:hypothetical protein
MRLKNYLLEDITVPINVGDIVLGGKFKNKKITVKKIGKNEKGDITINGKAMMRFRVIPQEVSEKLKIDGQMVKGQVFTQLTKSLTNGPPNICYENARVEYWAQKKKGKNPTYWKGEVYGYSYFADTDKFVWPNQHCFVTVGKKVYDPTKYFNLEQNKTADATKHFVEVKYVGVTKVSEDFLEGKMSGTTYLRIGVK